MVGLVIGATQGFLNAYQRIPSFIVTLGGMLAFRGLAMWVTQNSTIPLETNWLQSVGTYYVKASIGWSFTIGGLAIVLVSMVRSRASEKKNQIISKTKFEFSSQIGAIVIFFLGAMLVFSRHEGVPMPVLLMTLVVGAIYIFSTRTIWGRHIYAIGGNVDSAYLSGVPVRRRVLMIFTLMGALATLAAVMMTSRVGSASPDAGQLLELDAIAACVIGGTSLMGGKGNVFGAILGALVIESLNNGMSLANMEPFWQYILKGSVLICAVWIDVLSREQKA
jgi:D-xylose transport system permease protein